MTEPLQVYLDSSDYSVLSDETCAQDLRDIGAYLEQRVASGDVEIRYSYPLISEAAPTESQHIPSARRRFQAMHRLCGRRCFANYLQLWQAEARGDTSFSVYSEQGDWFPPFEPIEQAPPSPAELIEAQIAASGLSRHDRRRLSATYLKDGQATAAGLAQLRRAPSPRFIEQIVAKYPFRREQVERALDQYGWLSPKITTALLTESFRDLSNFDQWFAKSWDRAESISKWIRSGGERIEKLLLDSKTGIQQRRAAALAKGVDVAKIERMIEQSSTLPGALIANRILKSVCERFEIDEQKLTANWDTTPSVLTVGQIAIALLQDTSFAMNARRKARRSDAGDVLHAGHLPFVDVFRTDAYMTSLIGSARLPLKATVVGNIRLLRSSIEEALALPHRAKSDAMERLAGK